MSAHTDRKPAFRNLWGATQLRDGHVLYWWVEIIAILVFYFVYSAVRNADALHTEQAFNHAKQLMSWQRSIGIDHERTINEWSLHFKPLVVFANYYYGSLHFIVTIGVGIFLFKKWPNDYPRWRNTIGIATLIALIGFRFWPLMPPRLLDAHEFIQFHPGVHYGFTDTLAKYPTLWTFNSGAMKNISNQFAAMPSVHCCWALWCACALVPRPQARVGEVARGGVPGPDRRRHRDHREPLLPRRVGWLRDLRHRLHGGPAHHPRRAWSGDRTRTRARHHILMIDLDHVAIATDDIDAALSTLVGTLGGTLFGGGDGYGFRWVQTRLGTGDDGMTVELLTEWEPNQNDFLARFLAKHGPRQHHITFKVTDIVATLERVRSAGFQPVSVDLRDPEWMEAFLQPRGPRHRGAACAGASRAPGYGRARRHGGRGQRGLRAAVVVDTAAARGRAVSTPAGRDVHNVAARGSELLRRAARGPGRRRGRHDGRARVAGRRPRPSGAGSRRDPGLPAPRSRTRGTDGDARSEWRRGPAQLRVLLTSARTRASATIWSTVSRTA